MTKTELPSVCGMSTEEFSAGCTCIYKPEGENFADVNHPRKVDYYFGCPDSIQVPEQYKTLQHPSCTKCEHCPYRLEEFIPVIGNGGKDSFWFAKIAET